MGIQNRKSTVFWIIAIIILLILILLIWIYYDHKIANIENNAEQGFLFPPLMVFKTLAK